MGGSQSESSSSSSSRRYRKLSQFRCHVSQWLRAKLDIFAAAKNVRTNTTLSTSSIIADPILRRLGYVLSSAIYEINEQLLELQEEDSLDSSVNPEWYRREGNHYLGYSWVPIAPTTQQGKKQKKSGNNSDGAQRSTRGKVQKQVYYEDNSEDEDEKRCKVGPRVEAFLKEKKELNKKINEVSSDGLFVSHFRFEADDELLRW